jgi:hypothetical protein
MTAAAGTFVLIAACAACSFHASKQNPDAAAVSAVEFAKTAFVEREVERAYDLLDPEFQAYAPRERFAEVLTTMNSPSSPVVVTTTDFEQIPGQDGMNIFLTGESGDEKFYYRLAMKGSEEKGYRVAGVFRGPRPYAPSEQRRPLPMLRSTSE